MTSDAPELQVKNSKRFSLSIVWLVPILAALIGGGVAYQSFSERGPLVEIQFSKGHGFEAGKTKIKRNDVVVGLVEEVTLADDLDTVIVKARLDKVLEPYLGDTASFWVVTANVTGSGVTGLGTILSGAYIEIDWSGPPQTRRRVFVGADAQPLTPPGADGQHVALRTPTARSVTVGSPVFFRRIAVGRIESVALSDDLTHVQYSAFIEAPYDRIITPATRFWDVSGVSVTAGADGLDFDIASLEALAVGGIEFGDIGLAVLQTGTVERSDLVFEIFPNRGAALESRFDAPEEAGFLFLVQFDESIRGLQVGSPVEWQGIQIGRVHDIQIDLDPTNLEENPVSVILELQPSRLGLEGFDQESATFGLSSWVDYGMRVQLETGNLLSGSKVVRFVENLDAAPAEIDFTSGPYPELPTAPGDIEAVAQNVEDIVAQVANAPIEDLVVTALALLQGADTFINNDETQKLPGELNATLAALQSTAANLDEASAQLPLLVARMNALADAGEAALTGVSPDSQLYVDLSSAVRDLRDTARSLGAVAEQLENKPNALIFGD